MKTVGLFTGIGGFEVGLGKSGHSTILMCENDSAAMAVLTEKFNGIPIHPDIRSLKSLPEDTELICAGFPCQDLSQAGPMAGITGERSGLIKEVIRLAKAQRVPWILIENVSFMLKLQGGAALELITSALEDLGYRWAYRVVNSNAFGLPQRRERVFFLASLNADPADVLLVDEAAIPTGLKTGLSEIAHGFYWTEGNTGLGWAIDSIPTLKSGSAIGIPAPPAILLPAGNIITPDIRDAERLNGFPGDWTAPAEGAKRHSFRWKLVGNSVSVPVAVWIGNRLTNPGQYDVNRDLGPIPTGAWPRAARSSGGERIAVKISAAPVWLPRPHLHEFLRSSGKPLSLRATSGFYARACRSTLRFPDGFLEAVANHLKFAVGLTPSPRSSVVPA